MKCITTDMHQNIMFYDQGRAHGWREAKDKCKRRLQQEHRTSVSIIQPSRKQKPVWPIPCHVYKWAQPGLHHKKYLQNLWENVSLSFFRKNITKDHKYWSIIYLFTCKYFSGMLAPAHWKRICEPILESVHINVMIAISRFRKQQI